MENIKRFFKNKYTLILIALILIGAALRLYDLNWGAPYYFHPDERNIANSVTQLSFPTQLNPKFFAYGSLPIYAIYFTGLYTHFFHNAFTSILSFTEAIVISRIYSALFSILLIPLVYLIGKQIGNKTTGIIAAAFATSSVGFIQFSHFGTFEMWSTFFSTLLLYISLRLVKSATANTVIVAGVILGVLSAIKISNLVLIPLPLVALFLYNKHHARYTGILGNLKLFGRLGMLIGAGVIVYFVANPYILFDFPSFLGSMRYESGVATGTLPVFYTGEFQNALPILYPFVAVYPFLLNPLLTILFVPAFAYIIVKMYQTKNRSFLLLVTCYLLLFFSQAFLYVQWTRYFVPTIPFIILMIAIFIATLLKSAYRKFALVGIIILFAYASLYASSFVITTYHEQDTRLQAVAFAKTQIQPTQPIISEVYDLGIIPFNDEFSSITLYDFYTLDETATDVTIPKAVKNAAYIILPSQRIVKVRMQNPKAYPNGNAFYRDLLDGKLGFKKIYQTPCSIWCQIVYLNNPVYSFEGTASVFDRPVVMIFQKR